MSDDAFDAESGCCPTSPAEADGADWAAAFPPAVEPVAAFVFVGRVAGAVVPESAVPRA